MTGAALMDTWPSSWRSLGWASLAAEAAKACAGWVWRNTIYQFDPRRKYR